MIDRKNTHKEANHEMQSELSKHLLMLEWPSEIELLPEKEAEDKGKDNWPEGHQRCNQVRIEVHREPLRDGTAKHEEDHSRKTEIHKIITRWQQGMSPRRLC